MRPVFSLWLDAVSLDLFEAWTDDGTLPNLRNLRQLGIYGRLESVSEILTEAGPYALLSGQNPDATGLVSGMMWQKETMQARPPGKEWLPFRPFWRDFQQDSPRAIVIDVPNVYAPEPFNGLELVGWATHDALVPFQSFPPQLASLIKKEFGAELLRDEMYGPVRKRQFIDDRAKTLETNTRFRELCLKLMRQEKWDLFLPTLVTGHHCGHRLWSTASVKDALSDAERQDLSDTVRQVYVSIDQVVGELHAAVGNDAVFMVFSPHGMGVSQSRGWIFPEMLRRVLGNPPGKPGVVRRLRNRLPLEWRHSIKNRLPFQVRRGLTRYWRRQPHTWNTTRAFPLYSDTQGWIRINLKGREAQGVVEPGGDYDALCKHITDSLMTFVDADSGEPVIQDIIRPQQLYTGQHAAELPDLVVRWAETPAAGHRAIRSSQFGEIPWPTPGRNPEGRSGNHRGQGMLMAVGPGIRPGRLSGARVVDIAPTILSLLHQPIPAAMQGRPLDLVG